jgi:membrane-associated phospholipid phosphatase
MLIFYNTLIMPFKKVVLLACIAMFIAFGAFAQNFDIDLLRSINHKESAFKNNFYKATSQSVIYLSMAAPVAVFSAGIIKHDQQLKKDAVYMVGALIFSAVVTQGMKTAIKRDRPFITYPDIIQREEGSGYSLPSGHTSFAFCTATSLSLLFPKWYVVVPSYLYASTVGYARMYEGVHYPTDVLVGAVVGAGSAWLSFKVEKYLDKRHKSKRAVAPTPL